MGLIITGNVMVDRRAMTGTGTAALESGTPLEPFRRWAQASRKEGAQVWMQINHPGRQVMANMMALVKRRLRALGNGATQARRYSPLMTMLIGQFRLALLTRRYRAWLAAAG